MEEAQVDIELTKELLPRVLPEAWKQIEQNTYIRKDMLTVIVTAEVVSTQRWLHVSCARRNQLPLWADLRAVKDLFIGRDKQALQVLPSEDKYVNIHPFCLHLWHCLDGDVVPDMRKNGVI
jgi:hypothetical protein